MTQRYLTISEAIEFMRGVDEQHRREIEVGINAELRYFDLDYEHGRMPRQEFIARLLEEWEISEAVFENSSYMLSYTPCDGCDNPDCCGWSLTEKDYQTLDALKWRTKELNQ